MIKYRHLENKKSYTIEILFFDKEQYPELYKIEKEFCPNLEAGAYASPLQWEGDVIEFKSKIPDEIREFVRNNFEIVAFF